MMNSLRFHSMRILLGSGVLLLVVVIGAASSRAQFGFDISDVVTGASGASKLAKGMAGISLKEELDIGGSLAVEIAAKRGGILRDEAVTKRVILLGKALTLYCTRPHLNFTFAVLDDTGINAFSAPGGYVFVTRGLVDSCKDDNQLAAVLAHEIAHITRRHALKLVARNEGLKGLTELASVAGGSNVSGYDDLIAKGLTSILEKGFDPATEFDADKQGTQLACDAGFPATALRDYLVQLSKETEDKPFSTHPPIEHRVERLNDYLKENGMISGN